MHCQVPVLSRNSALLTVAPPPQLTLNIDASLTILSVPIPINFAHDISFPCPIDASVLQQIGGGDLLQVASGIGRRWLHALDDF